MQAIDATSAFLMKKGTYPLQNWKTEAGAQHWCKLVVYVSPTIPKTCEFNLETCGSHLNIQFSSVPVSRDIRLGGRSSQSLWSCCHTVQRKQGNGQQPNPPGGCMQPKYSKPKCVHYLQCWRPICATDHFPTEKIGNIKKLSFYWNRRNEWLCNANTVDVVNVSFEGTEKSKWD